MPSHLPYPRRTRKSVKRLAHGLLLTVGLVMVGCGGEEPADPPVEVQNALAETKPSTPGPLSDPVVQTSTCRVYAAEPGWHVFVNGEPALLESGEIVTAPCEVTIPLSRTAEIRLAKRGRWDVTEKVQGDGEAEVIADAAALNAGAIFRDEPPAMNTEPMETTDAPPNPNVVPGDTPEVTADDDASAAADPILRANSSALEASYLAAEVGEVVPLLSINTPQAEFDPYLEPNGQVLWFVGDRAEGPGIYRATRNSPYEFFTQAELIEATRSRSLPASPSVTDTHQLVYAIPEKARLMGLPVGPKAVPQTPDSLAFSRDADHQWTSAQVLGDAGRLYWTATTTGGSPQGFMAVRPIGKKNYTTPERQDLPGGYPCLSADGLRQYHFDGQQIVRYRRAGVDGEFQREAVIANIKLPLPLHDSRRRNWWVSEDEQWLFVALQEGRGDLSLVRLRRGVGWGFSPTGRPIADREWPKVEVPIDEGSLPFIPPEITVDPQLQPLKYTEVRQKFRQLMAAREYAAAEKLLADAAVDPQVQPLGEQVSWDQQDLQSVQRFWKDVRSAFAGMAADTEIFVGSSKVRFVKIENDELVYRLSREGRKPLLKMSATDLLRVYETSPADNSKDSAARALTFLTYESDVTPRVVEIWRTSAAETGAEFETRLARRLLKVAQAELARDRLAEAMKWIDAARRRYPESTVAEEATRVQAQLYGKIAWQPVGPRKWQAGEYGGFAATKEYLPKSFLSSPDTVGNFDLHLEYRIDAPGGSGGVFFRYAEPGKQEAYRNSFKIHFAGDKGFDPDPQTTGALYNLESPKKNMSKTTGEWNTARIRVKFLNVEVWINDELVLNTIAQNERVPLKGYIALDGVQGGISYRKLLLTPLSDNP